ncbi:MAG: hypothetical protein LBI38_03935 [Oscillospiraceae bacterium]|nr:hypothetical protein [Oscillospiraceae bacterium]
MEYQFQIFSPGGNDTALVFGLDFDKETERNIDFDIRSSHETVEQVGFVGKTDKVYRLEMAGGEFCGNAARCAASYFLKNTAGEIDIRVSGVTRTLKAGVRRIDTAWAAMPVNPNLDSVSVSDEGFCLVALEGIVHLVIPPDKSGRFLSAARSANSFEDELKSIAKRLMDKYSLTKHPACGVMFPEDTADGLFLHPCVFVAGVESSMYYETACGSGSIAVAAAFSFLNKDSIKLSVIQPSRRVIAAVVELSDERTVAGAYIDGAVVTDGRIVSVC